MLTLNDGRSELWQWDTGRKLTVDADCSQVHFSNKVFGRSIDVDVVDGVAVIPDILLQTDKDLNVWAFVGTPENGYTKISKVFKVNKRNKPADYVFTPPEQTTLEEIKEKLDYLESIQDPDAIKNAVDEYLANNPIQIDEKDPTVPDWAKQTTKPKYTATEVGAVAKVNGVKPDANGNVEITIPDSGGNVDLTGYLKLPTNEDGTPNNGTAGYYAVSDGNGGVAWVAAGNSGGGDTPVVPGSHGIVWDLANVTSSNNIASVTSGASLVAVLTPADGYTLGDVTVTMGGEVLTGVWNADTATVTIASVTGEVVISCVGIKTPVEMTETLVHEFKDYSSKTDEWTEGTPTDQYSVFMYPTLYGGIYSVDWNTEECNRISFGLYTFDENGRMSGRLKFASFIGQGDCGQTEFVARTESGMPNVGYTDATGPFSFGVPEGYRCAIFVRRGSGTGTQVDSNGAFTTWVHTGATVTVTVSDSVPEATAEDEPSVMMLSFNRAYVDSGVYTEDLTPKWDGMFSIHRGMSTAPDNTLQAIWEAKKHGYTCCELDVRYSSDNQVVLCHDPTVTGTVNGEEVTYTVAETDLATLKTVCVGDTKFPNAMVCSLEDAMRLCRRIGMRPEIDYKVSNEQIYKDCVALSKKYGLQDDTLHCCYGINYAVIVKTEYEKANLRVSGESLDDDTTLEQYLTNPGNIYAYYAATACGKTGGSNVGANVTNETRILTHKEKGYKMYVWNVTPYLLPDVMQWEPDILQPQSSKDGSDWFTLIRELNSFDGLVW